MTVKRNGKDPWKSSIQKARTHFGRGVRDLRHAARDARADGHEVLEMAQGRIRGMGERARRSAVGWVRKNPLQALKITALTGMVLGGWWSRRRSS